MKSHLDFNCPSVVVATFYFLHLYPLSLKNDGGTIQDESAPALEFLFSNCPVGLLSSYPVVLLHVKIN